MYDRILLPTDGSEASAAAAEHAAAIAEPRDATVEVFSVADSRNRFESPSSGLAPEAWDEAEHDRATAAVEQTAAALPDSVAVEETVASGIPRDEILDRIEASPADLVVMGTHSRTGIDRYLIGSVTERIVRHSPVPVVTVRGDAGNE